MIKYLLFFLLLIISIFGEEVVFISFHPGPSEHFKDFSVALTEGKVSHVLIGGDLATKIWQGGFLIEKKQDGLDRIIKECAKAKVVITDSDPFCFEIHQALKEKSPFARRLLYYDNPEPFVPGGYSENIKKLIQTPLDGVIFANFHLADQPILEKPRVEIDFADKKRFGLGYYPLHDVEQIKKAKAKRDRLTLLYIGAANQEYYEKIIPHFTQLLLLASPLENVRILFQQHPRAKIEGNMDIAHIQKFAPFFEKRGIEFIYSDKPLIEAAATADCILYSQSSAAPKFILAGIPTLQVAPTPFEDVLIKNGIIASVQTPEAFIREIGLASVNEEKKKRTLFALGIAEDWKSRLIEIIKQER